MLIGVDNVLKAFDAADCDHWKLYYNAAKQTTPIQTSSKEGNVVRSESRNRLEAILRMLSPGNYKIDFKSDWNQSNHFNSVLFELRTDAHNQAPAIGGYMQGNVPAIMGGDYVHKDDIKKTVREMMAQERLQSRVEELEEQLKEAQQSSLSTAISGLLQNYGPVIIPALASKLGVAPTAVGLAGYNPPPATTPTPTATEAHDLTDLDSRMDLAIQAMIKIEGSPEATVLLLEKLVLWIGQNPAMYLGLKPTILNTQKIESSENI